VVEGGPALSEGLSAGTLWADLEVMWRADDGTTVPVALIALPAFGRRGDLVGFRGAGTIEPARRRPAAPAPRTADAEPTREAGPGPTSHEHPAEASDAAGPADVPVLSFAEQGAFAEIARALGARIEPAGPHDVPADRATADILTLPVRAPRGPPAPAPATSAGSAAPSTNRPAFPPLGRW
jgi:hypothetical protein